MKKGPEIRAKGRAVKRRRFARREQGAANGPPRIQPVRSQVIGTLAMGHEVKPFAFLVFLDAQADG